MPSTLGKVKVMGVKGARFQGRCPPPGVPACPGAWQRRVTGEEATTGRWSTGGVNRKITGGVNRKITMVGKRS